MPGLGVIWGAVHTVTIDQNVLVVELRWQVRAPFLTGTPWRFAGWWRIHEFHTSRMLTRTVIERDGVLRMDGFISIPHSVRFIPCSARSLLRPYRNPHIEELLASTVL